MSKRSQRILTEDEIDDAVIAEADDDSAWSEPIQAHVEQPTSIALSGDLAARAAFLARMHRERSLKDWLLKVVRERIELEEGAFVEAKREFAMKTQG